MIEELVDIILILLLIVFISLEIYKKFNRSWQLIKKIPGLPGYPFIGSLLYIAQANAELQFKADRERQKKHRPIYSFSVFNSQVITFINPGDIEQILTNVKHSTKSDIYHFLHDWLGTGLLTSGGSKWQNRRKILTPAFHFNILLGFLKVFNEETKNLINVIKNNSRNGVIDVVPLISDFTLSSINETAMGTKLTLGDNDARKYKKAIYKMGNLLIKRISTPWLYNNLIYNFTKNGREFKKTTKTLHELSNHVIKERIKTFDKDKVLKEEENCSYSIKKRLAMLDLLLSANFDGAIDLNGIREEVDTFMFEGHDTTAMAICYALVEIANDKQVQESIYQEIQAVLSASDSEPTYYEINELKYLERVVKEVLRLYPSVPYISRICGEEFVSTTGYIIPKGSPLDIFIYDLHRDPNIYPDPDKFNPDRFLLENCKDRHPFAYLPFSAGPRNCIGQKFALLEVKAVLVGILKEFILEPIYKPEEIVYITDMILRPNENGIKVKFVPRNKN